MLQSVMFYVQDEKNISRECRYTLNYKLIEIKVELSFIVLDAFSCITQETTKKNLLNVKSIDEVSCFVLSTHCTLIMMHEFCLLKLCISSRQERMRLCFNSERVKT